MTTPSYKSIIPWHYRFGLTNWLMAKPWRWNYKAIWDGVTPGLHPLHRLWVTIAFPHVHHPSEFGDDDA